MYFPVIFMEFENRTVLMFHTRQTATTVNSCQLPFFKHKHKSQNCRAPCVCSGRASGPGLLPTAWRTRRAEAAESAGAARRAADVRRHAATLCPLVDRGRRGCRHSAGRSESAAGGTRADVTEVSPDSAQIQPSPDSVKVAQIR